MNIIYHNPNEHWISPIGDVQPEQAVMAGCFGGFVYILFIFLFVCVMIALGGCAPQNKVITVPEVHTEHHWHIDSVIQHDSVTTQKTTTIRELDSTQMAEYGIKLKNAQRAWLIETDMLHRQISELKQLRNDSTNERDSVPVPVPVPVEVPAAITGWQWFQIYVGRIALLFFIAVVSFYFIFRRWRP